MKAKHLILAITLPIIGLLTACDTPEKQQERATDIITLANQQVNTTEAAARQALEDKKYVEDPAVRNLYLRPSTHLGYIKLIVENDTVVGVEAGQDHKTRTEAEQTAKIWSKFVFSTVFPEVSYYRAQTISLDNDTVDYMDGVATTSLTSVVEAMHTYKLIADEDYNNFMAAAARNHAQYLLDIEDKAEGLDTNKEGIYYSPDFKLDGSLSLLTLSKLLTQGYDFESAEISVYEKEMYNKTYYRTVYHHDSEAELSFSEIIGF